MKRGILAGLSLSASLVLAGCIGGNFGTPFRETVDESRSLAANGELKLENTNGTVEVTTWDESRVRIEATKHASSERALEEMKVEISGEGDRVTVRTRYPKPRWMGGGGKVDYRVSVPRQASVRVSNVNGRVGVDGVLGGVTASTVNGPVELSDVAGEVEASAVNGGVEVELARVASSGHSEIRTTNGSVRLTLPRDAGAEVQARTVNGSVGCDFELEGGQKSRRKLDGRIGGGGARFELKTVNGSVHIDRGLSSAAPGESSRPAAEAEPGASRS